MTASLLGLRDKVNQQADLGSGQSWQNPSRAYGVWYENDTSNPIVVCVSADTASNGTCYHLLYVAEPGIVNSKEVARGGKWPENTNSGFYENLFISATVPPGHWYRADTVGMALTVWAELR